MTRVLAVVDNLGRALRAMLGVPDYERYVEHCRSEHPGMRPMTRDEFSSDLLDRKYSRPGSRCC
ncbi:MAG: YbdD/YjiX family protein [Gemmatimonadota bacterium]|nr:YbdD/YjiX family protein [Gemmatimonadota bacterium]HYN79892.1 YbdD/YjiX family protein [Gemmatimonadaceae bacterium]